MTFLERNNRYNRWEQARFLLLSSYILYQIIYIKKEQFYANKSINLIFKSL